MFTFLKIFGIQKVFDQYLRKKAVMFFLSRLWWHHRLSGREIQEKNLNLSGTKKFLERNLGENSTKIDEKSFHNMHIF